MYRLSSLCSGRTVWRPRRCGSITERSSGMSGPSRTQQRAQTTIRRPGVPRRAGSWHAWSGSSKRSSRGPLGEGGAGLPAASRAVRARSRATAHTRAGARSPGRASSRERRGGSRRPAGAPCPPPLPRPRTFQALRPGQAFTLVNDHDPVPLYYQFKAEQPEKFTWTYLAQGPEVWRVRIGRV